MQNNSVFALTDAIAGVSASDSPELVRLHQNYPRPVEPDVAAAVHRELETVLDRDLAGQKIAITGSSRGIVNFDVVVRECVAALRQRGAEPFVIPGMGSHGGATVEGQIDVLANINNVTEATVGCPIRATMEVIQVGTTSTGFPVFQDRMAHEADGVLLVNRVKPHTGFTERVESGLCKMMVIGLGKQAGASRIHNEALRHGMGRLILDASKIIVESDRPKFIGGVTVVENAFKETASLRATRVTSIDELLDFESPLLEEAYRLMPTLPFAELDGLVVDEIGKNISGSGMDTNVTGKKIGLEKPNIASIFVRGLTEATHGNAVGIGFADVMLRSVIEQIDLNATYMNAFTAKRLNIAKLPMAVENDLQAIQLLQNFRQQEDPKSFRMAWIKNTSMLREMWITPSLIEDVQGIDGLEVIGEPAKLQFDDRNMMVEPGA